MGRGWLGLGLGGWGRGVKKEEEFFLFYLRVARAAPLTFIYFFLSFFLFNEAKTGINPRYLSPPVSSEIFITIASRV